MTDRQLAKKNVVTIQLLGKGDTTVDDAVTTQEKWQQYIDSYTLVSDWDDCSIPD